MAIPLSLSKPGVLVERGAIKSLVTIPCQRPARDAAPDPMASGIPKASARRRRADSASGKGLGKRRGHGCAKNAKAFERPPLARARWRPPMRL
jgi:hypothetical protein